MHWLVVPFLVSMCSIVYGEFKRYSAFDASQALPLLGICTSDVSLLSADPVDVASGESSADPEPQRFELRRPQSVDEWQPDAVRVVQDQRGVMKVL